MSFKEYLLQMPVGTEIEFEFRGGRRFFVIRRQSSVELKTWHLGRFSTLLKTDTMEEFVKKAKHAKYLLASFDLSGGDIVIIDDA